MAIIVPVLQLVSVLLVTAVSVAFYRLVWKPLSIRRALRAQGISGPPYRLIVGSLPEVSSHREAVRARSMSVTDHYILPRVLPHYIPFSEQYGSPFVYWMGHRPRLTLPNPEHCKEVLSNKSGSYIKPESGPDLQDLLGRGLATLNGENWAHHRRIVGPAFFMEKLKAMTPTIANLASNMLDAWHSQVRDAGGHKEIDVHEEFQKLTADVIAHTAFGSSHVEGKCVFQLQQKQLKLFLEHSNSVYIPGSRYIPLPSNQYRWNLKKQIQSTLEGIINQRLHVSQVGKDSDYGNDLLGIMMSAYKEDLQGKQKDLKLSMQEIIDECKTFFFAGHETTASLLTWTVMLLAVHAEWQEKAREEVLSLFGNRHPCGDNLHQLKTLSMILYESLRLYPPAVAFFREALKDVRLGNTVVPAGTTFLIPILALHVDSTLWGANAHIFEPQRFSDGVLKACKNPMAYIPFSAGPRNCVGQNFAIVEAKVVLCMILQQFQFQISPGYKHAPMTGLTLQPEHGMQIIFKKL